MQEEVSTFLRMFQAITEWLNEHWPWLSGTVAGVWFVLRSAYRFLDSVNRMEKTQAELVERITGLEEKQEATTQKITKLVDEDGVDKKVEPVVLGVNHLVGRIDKLYEHFIKDEK